MNRNQKYGLLILISIILLLGGLYLYFEANPTSQNNSDVQQDEQRVGEDEKKEKTFTEHLKTDTTDPGKVEKMPEFPGGEDAMNDFLSRNLSYPAMAKEQGIQGKVWIGFMVDKFGNVENVEILRGIGGGCDEEAKRVVEMMPRWNPGTQDGKPVNVKFRFPINFNLK
jgi:TonB family protein